MTLCVSCAHAALTPRSGAMPGKGAAAAAALKAACLEAAANSVQVATDATDGRRVIGKSAKYGSRAEAEAAKIEAAKARRAAAAAEAKK